MEIEDFALVLIIIVLSTFLSAEPVEQGISLEDRAVRIETSCGAQR